MIHVNDVRLAQLVLIEVGALLQLAALGTFMRESAKPSREVPGVREAQLAHLQELKCKLPETPRPATVVQYERELHGVMENVPEDIRPADLVKTAKVSFKQSLRPYPMEKSDKPAARW